MRLGCERKASCSRHRRPPKLQPTIGIIRKSADQGAASGGWHGLVAVARRFCCACACDAGIERAGSGAKLSLEEHHHRRVDRRRHRHGRAGAALCREAAAALGKPVVVENKPGAATMLAAAQVATSPPDGHTLVVLTSAAMAINQTLYKQINYSPENDFVPISLYVKSPFILVVNPDAAGQDGAGVHQPRQAGEAPAQLRDGRGGRVCSICRWNSPSSDSVSTRSMCLTARPGNRSPIWPRATSTRASSRPARRSR